MAGTIADATGAKAVSVSCVLQLKQALEEGDGRKYWARGFRA